MPLIIYHTAGGYAYLDITKTVNPYARGVMNSTEISATHASCFSFSYMLDGPHGLNIFQQHGRDLQSLWFHEGPQGAVWMDGQVTVASDELFNILVEGTRADTVDGNIAIDSITLTDGPCIIPEESCDFESDHMCGWQPLGSPGPNDPKWVWADGQDVPLIDHTTGTENGHVLRASNNWNSSALNSALISSKLYSPQAVSCVRFFYFALKGTAAILRLYYAEDDTAATADLAPVIVWEAPVGQVSEWMEGRVDISINFFKIQVQAIFETQDNTSFVAFDDFSIHYGTCGNAAECNFEGSNFCGWTHLFNEEAFWDITISNDHTNGDLGGKMLVLEPTKYEMGDAAVLRSPIMTPAAAISACLQFWFHMNDTAEGTVNFYIEPVEEMRILVWSMSSVQSSPWNVGRVPLHGVTDGYFFIQLEGIVGANQLEKICIDDVLTFTGQCSIWPEEAQPNNNTDSTSTTIQEGSTTTPEPLGENDCDFESFLLPTCLWYISNDNGTVPWIWWHGPTDTLSPGPATDHTLGTDSGHYMYVEAQWSFPPSSAVMYRDQLEGVQCLRFWYYMFGEKTPDLIATTEENGIISEPIFFRTGSQGDFWHLTSMNIQASSADYNAVIRAVWNESCQGIIAVDDIRLHSGSCVHNPSDPHALHDFEENGSSFSLISGGQVEWSTMSTGKEPDHTLGTLKGHFARADLSKYSAGEQGKITSPVYKIQGITYRCVNFYYYLSGLPGTSKLSAFIQNTDDDSSELSTVISMELLFEQTESQGDHWVKVERHISEITNFHLIFEAQVLENNTKAVIGIDDVYTNTEVCEGYECDFEHDLCSWTNSQDILLNWLFTKPKKMLKPGPLTDFSCHPVSVECSQWIERKKIYVIITGMLDFEQNTYIALDEVQYIENGQCGVDYIMPSTADPTIQAMDDIACGFDIDTCRWIGSDMLKVGMEAGVHADQDQGNYLYLAVHDSNEAPYQSVLQSRRIAENPRDLHDYCFHFWYYMFGSYTPWLSVKQNIFRKQWNNLSTTNILWDRVSGMIDLWHEASVAVDTNDGDCQLELEVTVDPASEGTVAFDDVEIWTGPCEASLIDCDFEVNSCGWENDDKYPLTWSRVIAEEGSESMGYDHTTNTQRGHYMFPQLADSLHTEGYGLLVGPYLTAGGGEQCLRFWYNIEGLSTIGLLAIGEEGNENELWSHAGNRINGWTLGRVDVNVNRTMKLAFKAEYPEEFGNSVVLDDISLVPDHCPSNILSCDFDESLCGWSNVFMSTLPWLVGQGFTIDPDIVSGPFTDHTSQDGLYAYIDFTVDGVTGGVSQLISEEVPFQDSACLSFWYLKYGESMRSGILSVRMVKIHDNNHPFDLLNLDNTVNVRHWTHSMLNISSPENFYITFDATKVTSDQFIAIDDISYFNEDCTSLPATTPAPSQFVTCDFEADDLCGFTQRQDDNFDWTHGTGSDNALLPNDHTTGDISGHYLYVDSSKSNSGAYASLAAPVVSELPEACVALVYFTSSKTGVLQVWLHTQEIPEAILLGEFSAPFDTWTGVRMSVLAAGVWQIELKVVVEHNGGFIGIDDYIMGPGACPDPVSCDFEDGICLWQNLETNKWTTGRVTDDPSQSPGFQYAPPYDHTSETPYGHYLYFYDGKDDASSAKIISETFTTEKDSCFSYWLHMFGDKVGKLQLLSLSAGESAVMKTIEGSQGYEWQQFEIEIRETYQQWLEFAVEGVAGHINVVALDDIELYAGSCLDNSSLPDFRCNNGDIIPQNEICDYIVQCVESEDEKWCADCNFSEDTCGWHNIDSSQDNTHLWWQRLQDATVTQYDPHFYHMEVQEKEGPVINQPRMLTNLLQPTHHSCVLKMDYELFASVAPGPKLSVYLDRVGSDLTMLYEAQSHLKEWQTLQLPLGRVSSSYHLLVEASSSNDPSQIIAFDELELLNCYPPEMCYDLPEGYQWCDNKACFPNDALCDFTDDCGDYSDEASCENYPLRCSFENQSLCGWTASEFFNLTQARMNSMAPFRDHTVNSGDGHIMLLASRSPRHAIITSPLIALSDNCQIRLYHAVSGAGSTYLRVRLRSFKNEAIISEETIQSHEEGTFYWQHFSQSYSVNEIYYFELEGEIQEWGSVGLDDISLTPECLIVPATITPPPLTTTKGPCEEGFFPCEEDSGSVICIEHYQVCDFNKDCPRNDDEILCGTTDFESDYGGWQDVSDTAYAWSWIKAADTSYPNCSAPNFDHSTLNGEGHYMWAPAKLSDIPEATATMETPALGPSGLACTMSLWYYCQEEPTLTIMAWTTDEIHELISSKDLPCYYQGQEWHENQLFIGEQTVQFTTEVRSTKFSSLWSNTQYDVAVDDITFSQCSLKEPPTAEDIKCSFSEPCNLYQSHKDDMDWEPYVEYYNTFMTANGDNENQTAVLETQQRIASVGFCVSFRYFIIGKGSLEIAIISEQSNETVWRRGGGMNFLDWYIQHLSLFSVSEYQIWIISHTGNPEDEIKLDDVAIISGPCPASLTCSFDDETEACEWENFFTDSATLPWSIGSGSENITSAPAVDHSWGTAYGHYQFLNLQINQNNQLAYLRSQEISTTTPEGDCFQFWFYLYSVKSGEDVGELGVRLLANQTVMTERIWQHTFNGRDGWQYGETTIKYETNFSVVLEGLRLSGSQGFMAWDDLTVKRGACEAPGTCDFEGGLCGWKDVPDSYNNNWAWLKAEETRDGMLTDHTTGTGNGHYVSFDLAQCNYGSSCYGDLVSSDITPQGSQYCLHFYMSNLHSEYDKNTVLLEVVNVEENTSQLVASYVNNYNNIWTYFQQQLNILNHVFHLRFRSKMLINLLDDGAYNALDDVEFSLGECKSSGTTVVPISTPAPDTQLTCTFENGNLCGWRQDLADGRDWILSTGEIINSPLGPQVDYTTHLSGGHFIYIASTGPLSLVNLFSEVLESSDSGNCLSFSFYMHGTAPPFLKLFILKAGEKPGISSFPDWVHLREMGETWQQVHLFIQKQEYAQYIALVGNTQNSNGDLGHSAVDDILLTDGSCDSLRGNTCDFETSDLCEWTPTADQGATWIWNSGQNLDHSNGPNSDHTFDSAEGHYVSLKHSTDNKNAVAYLTSPTHQSSGAMCLQFYFFMQGRTNWTGSLSLYVKSPSVDINFINPVWKITGHQGDAWNLGEKSLNFVSEYHTVFAAVEANDGGNSIIAVDDVAMLDRDCPAAATCTFEDGYCDWSNIRGSDTMDWVMNSGYTPTANTGPNYDHTLHTVYGHYLYIETDSVLVSSSAVLESSLIPSGTYCFEFYYSMYGKDIGAFAVRVVRNNTVNILFQKFGNQGPDWKLGKVQILEEADFTISMMALSGNGNEGDIAIDDTWTSKNVCFDNPDKFVCSDGEVILQEQVCDFIPNCVNGDDEMFCGDCNFEFGTCGWNFQIENDYIWSRGHNLSNDHEYLNIYDHTLGTDAGYYIYVAQYSNDHSGPAVMLTDTHHNAYIDCTMDFWVREYSDSYNGMHIRVAVSVVKDGQVSPMFYLIDQGNYEWQQASAILTDWTGEFVVQVEGQTNAGLSDLTIDDITFSGCAIPSHSGDCPMYNVKCTQTGLCIPSDFLCDNTNDCGDFTDEMNCESFLPMCTLEEDESCDWNQESDEDDIDWVYGKGHTVAGGTTFLTGPPVDHTLRLSDGHYMYVTSPASHTQDNRQSKMTSRAWFVSPVMMEDDDSFFSCELRFYYYMYGINIEELNVYIRTEIHGDKTLSFTRKGEQGQFWDRSVVPTTTHLPFQFVIEGVTNNIGLSDIAIDDLSFTESCLKNNDTLPGGNTPVPPFNPCAENEFYCNVAGECISLYMKCDWKKDCSNGVDEENCGACTFEFDMCGWSDDSEGIFHWRQIIASDFSQYTHPNVDHTYCEADGHFVYVEGSDKTIGKTAVLMSPPLSHTTGYYCELHFWLFLENGMNANLNLYYHIFDDHLLYNLTHSGMQEKTWYEVLVAAQLVPSTAYFKITVTPVFDQTSDWAESHSSLAIDDISFFNCNENFLNLDCDFDAEGICTWRQDQTDQQDWMKSASSVIPDHTSGAGHYVFVDFSQEDVKKGDKARLISTVQSKPVDVRNIFTLWYYIYGSDVGKFRVIEKKQNLKENSTLFEIDDSQEERWILFEQELDTDDDYSIILETEWRKVGSGMVAVDDVKITSKVQNSLCDFEIDFCQWQSSSGDTTQWIRGRGQQNKTGTPLVDHTHNTMMGYYAYLNQIDSPGKVGTLTSPEYRYVGVQCLRFWYHVLGDNVGYISVQVADQGGSGVFDSVWSHENNTFEMWSLGMVTLPTLQMFIVRFEGITGANSASVIALDDVEFLPNVCPRTHECDFEYDLCDWFNTDEDDTFDWQLSSGIEGGGILVDHTINFETGHYMVASLQNKTKGSNAKLFGGTVPTYLNCMTFWYSMQHIKNAVLKVILLDEGDNIPLVKLYNSTLDYLWEEVTLTIDKTPDTYEVMFELSAEEDIKFSEFNSVAIDDTAFTTDCKLSTLPPPVTTAVPTHLPTIYDCDFEQDDSQTCGWMQATNDDLDWNRWQGKVPTVETGPKTDHTLMTEDGHYIYVGTINEFKRDATLVSPPVDMGVHGACLSFWFHMHGFDVGSLQVQLQQVGTNSSKSAWQRSHEQGDDWIQAKVHLQDVGVSHIVLVATPNSYGKGTIAIDDITLDFGFCNTGKLCDFESDNICQFEQSIEDDLDWELVTVSSSHTGSEVDPEGDHSQQSSLGHFLKLSGEGSAVIFTNDIHPQYCCVEFWVYLNGYPGHSSSDLHVYSRINQILEPKINITDIIGRYWSRYLLPITTSFYYSLVFESHVRDSGYVVGIDDVQPLLSCEPMEECNFETDFCMWKNSVNENQFDWSITAGEDLDSIYAPNVDVTLSSPYGKYAYVDTYRENSSVEKPRAVLESNVIEPMELCISFWYHIKAQGKSSLILSSKDIMSDEISNLWEYPSSLFAEWKYEQVPFKQFNRHTIQFNAISDSGNGIIALDQVKVMSGNCSNSTVPDCAIRCDGGATCIHEDQMCNFIQECNNGEDENFCGYNCTFDEYSYNQPPCAWRSVKESGLLSWLPLSGQLNSSYGPPLDHTFLTPLGNYMAVAPVTNKIREETAAILQSPALHNSASYCLMTFWYVMYGKPDNLSSTFIDTLTAIFQVDDLSTELLKISGDKGDEWMHGVTYIGRISPQFYVRFEGTRNLDIDGYMAVDDIMFERCFLPTPHKQSGECTEYECSNFACVSSFDCCDFVDDCGDSSDEIDSLAGCDNFVGRCSFEDHSFCSWIQEEPNNWHLGSPSVQDIIPQRDHTLNTATGSFIFVSDFDSNKNTTVATLLSPVMRWKDEMISPCVLRFFYYIDGPAEQYLSVSSRNTSDGPLNLELTISKAVGSYWERAEILLASPDILHKPFQYIIKGERLVSENEKNSVIALDDLSFTESCVLSNDVLPTASPSSSTTTSGTCNNQFQCENGECIPVDYVCNFVANCMDGSDEALCAECTFESNTCGWSDVSYGSYGWIQDEPSVEGRDGKVMIVEKISGSSSKVANLISVPLGPSAASCTMSFFYYKHKGKDDETGLHVNLKTNSGNEYTIWYVLTDMNATWHEQVVGIGEHEVGWSLHFQASHYDTEGLIMIDSVHFENCSKPSSTICKPHEYRCDNGVCVSIDKFCDFNDDCGDSTDEIPAFCKNYPERCNFEDDFCNWKLENSDLEWIRKTGKMVSEDVGPDYDHTYGNETGYYLYLGSGDGSKGKIGEISSAAFYPTTSGLCIFRFWYIMRANQGATLTVFAEETSSYSFTYIPSSKLFETNGSVEYLWTKASVPVSYTRYFKILLEGKVGEEFSGDIAIDDVSFTTDCKPASTLPTVSPTPGLCPQGKYYCYSGECISNSKVCDFRYDCSDSSDEIACPSDCNFEVNNCGWHEAVNDELDWVLAKADDSQFGTNIDGPLVDETHNEDGHFLLLYKTSDHLLYDKGLSFTHWYQNSAPDCHFIFWYFQNGILGSNIVLRLNSTPYDITNLTFFNGDIGDGEWQKGEVGIGRQKRPFQLSLYKEPAEDYFGRFAVDETSFHQSCHYPDPSDNGCLISEFHCQLTKVCILTEKLCDLNDDCGENEDEAVGECLGYHFFTFEDSKWQEWFSQGKDGIDDDFDWTLWSGSTDILGTGPNFDHTTSSYAGHYMYLETSHPQQYNEKAWLVSYLIIAGPDCTITFYSHIYGTSIGSLTVLIRNESQSDTASILAVNTNGNFWVKQTLAPTLLPQKRPFNLIIEGKVGEKELGDIAIDDFAFSPDCRLYGQPDRNCTLEEHECSDGTCLPLKSRCNFVVDCPNGDDSDEIGCVSQKCTFEGQDLCHWEIKANQQSLIHAPQTDTFTWKLLRGEDPVDNEEQLSFKPDVDHTHGNGSSYFVFTSASEGQYESATDLMTTIAIGESSTTCRLRMWYWMVGPQPGSLHLQLISASNEVTEAWMVDSSQGFTWILVEIPLKHLFSQYVSLRVQRGVDYEGATSLDDVEYIDCVPPSSPPIGLTCIELGMFQCRSGACVDEGKVCDYSNDCFDSSDEQSSTCSPYKFRCNFEDGLCSDWKPETENTGNWILLQASSDVIGTLPAYDHTLSTTNGHYLKFNGDILHNRTTVAQIRSPVIQGISRECFFRMWYQFLGNKPGIISVYKRYTYYENGLELLTQLDTTVKNVWLKINLPLHNNSNLQDYVEGPTTCSNGKCYYPTEACNFKDDCGDGTDERDCTKSCDFEKEDLCGWFESSANSIHWIRSGFPALPPGPLADHSHSNVTHDLVTSKNEGEGGQVAVLESTTFTSVGRDCTLDFWHFLATDTNEESTLTLFRKTEEDEAHGLPAETLWVGTSLYSNGWSREYIHINGKRDFTLHFKANHGPGGTHIAVDDIQFRLCEPTIGECQTSTDFQCIDGSCIPYQYVCDAKYDCIDKSDEYNCTYVEVTQLESPKLMLRYYVYVSRKNAEPYQLASLVVDYLYPASENVCYIRFWYYMHADADIVSSNVDVGTLRVNLEVRSGQRITAVSISGNYDALWRTKVVLINMDKSYTVFFEAETGMSKYTYIALDDVSFTPECKTGVGPPPINSSCELDELKCKTGECVPAAFFCDCFADCIDGSDEVDCSTACTTVVTRPTIKTTPSSNISTVTTTTTQNPSACRDTEFACDDILHTCIPSLLLCDGISDCPNDGDENLCPEKTPCDPGFFYCADRFMEIPCMRVSNLCDGKVQCLAYKADESLCGQCPDYYCQNNGDCAAVNGDAPVCRCTDKYKGNRCELLVPLTTTIPPTTTSPPFPSSGGGLSAGAIVGIILGVLVFIILLSVIAYYFIKKRQYPPLREESNWDDPRHQPYFGLDMPQPAEDEYPLEDLSESNTAEGLSKSTSNKPVSDL
nr:MAM and LDL-receptor class A domain-containing protein 1-like [Cherax quadricarinatus]